jgi:hypothetical protein
VLAAIKITWAALQACQQQVSATKVLICLIWGPEVDVFSKAPLVTLTTSRMETPRVGAFLVCPGQM